MSTITKVLGGAAVVGTLLYFAKKKSTTASTTTTTLSPAVQAAVDTNPFENKLVVQNNGNWFAIHNGKRWYTGSIEAIADFQRNYPGNDTPIMNVTEAALKNIPIAGSLQKGLVYQETVLSMPDYGLGVDRGFCTMKNKDGSNTIYGESMTSANPCPRGGNLMPKKVVAITGV